MNMQKTKKKKKRNSNIDQKRKIVSNFGIIQKNHVSLLNIDVLFLMRKKNHFILKLFIATNPGHG